MRRNRRWIQGAVVIGSVLLVALSLVGAEDSVLPEALTSSGTTKVSPDETSLYEQIPLFTDAITFIRKYYVHDVSAKDLMYGALKGMVSTLDPFSEFMPPKKYEAIKTETKGEFGGIGLVVSMKENDLTVIAPMEGTPAERAGLKQGDIITDIDGVSTKDLNFTDAVEKMRGPKGSTVTLSVIRKSNGTSAPAAERETADKPANTAAREILTFTITRAVIEVENIKDAMMLADGIGYVRVVDFGEKTKKLLTKALAELEGQGMKALILDLRNNPGGLLDAAVAVSELFLKKGALIVYTKDRSGTEQLRFESSGKHYSEVHPLVVLVNKGSASGSEIVAGAIKDNKRGIIIGTTTFGKASVQTVIPMRDASALRLTTALYYTPSGVSIHGKGIEPNIVVEYRNALLDKIKDEDTAVKESYLYDKTKRKEILAADEQITRAIDVIKGINVWDTVKDT